jgi:hypothetical protein
MKTEKPDLSHGGFTINFLMYLSNTQGSKSLSGNHYGRLVPILIPPLIKTTIQQCLLYLQPAPYTSVL